MNRARSDFIYWSDYGSGDIRRANLDGSGQTTLVTGLNVPSQVALDLAAGQMYWGNIGGGDIRRANLDGSGQTTLISGLPQPAGLALDLVAGHMYWSSDNFGGIPEYIARANLDGTGQTTLISGLSLPRGPALDISAGKMYWADNLAGDIRRANLDGTGETTLIGRLSGPKRPALDIPNGKIYWAEDTGTIRRANLDGSGQEIVLRNLNGPSSIALDVANGHIYWSDGVFYNSFPGAIRRANLDGSEQQTLITGLNNPIGIALDVSAPAPLVVTGYSADVISDKDPSARLAQPFGAGTLAWFETGAVDDNGVQHDNGLPAGLTFVSATAGCATYQIQPANANNVLQLGAGQLGTLNLTAPTAYSRLYVLASSGDGTSSSVGSGNINFADGSTQAFSYNVFDWCNGPGSLHPEAVLSGPIGRADVGPSGTAFTYNQDCDFEIYETVISIDPSHAGVAIVSIDFTAAPDAYSSNIFGVSGK
jgi:hypothetical protein